MSDSDSDNSLSTIQDESESEFDGVPSESAFEEIKQVEEIKQEEIKKVFPPSVKKKGRPHIKTYLPVEGRPNVFLNPDDKQFYKKYQYFNKDKGKSFEIYVKILSDETKIRKKNLANFYAEIKKLKPNAAMCERIKNFIIELQKEKIEEIKRSKK